jgi:hypothetical protein
MLLPVPMKTAKRTWKYKYRRNWPWYSNEMMLEIEVEYIDALIATDLEGYEYNLKINVMPKHI